MSKKTVSLNKSLDPKQSKEAKESFATIFARPTQHQYDLIKLYADKAGVSLSRYVTEMALSSGRNSSTDLRYLVERIQFELSFINYSIATLSRLSSRLSSSPKLQQQLISLTSSLLHSSKFLFELFHPPVPISLCFDKLSKLAYPYSFTNSSSNDGVAPTADNLGIPSSSVPNPNAINTSDLIAIPINASYSDTYGNIIDFDHILVRKTPVNPSLPLEDTFALEQTQLEPTNISNLTKSIPSLVIDSQFTISISPNFNPTTLLTSINSFVHLQSFSSHFVQFYPTYFLVSPLPSLYSFSPISTNSPCKVATSSSNAKVNYISQASNNSGEDLTTFFSFSDSYFSLQKNLDINNGRNRSSSPTVTTPNTKTLPSSKTALIDAMRHQDELDYMAENDPQAYAQYMDSFYEELGEFDPSLYLDDENYEDDYPNEDDEDNFLQGQALYERKFGEPLDDSDDDLELDDGDENENDQDEDEDDEDDPSSIT